LCVVRGSRQMNNKKRASYSKEMHVTGHLTELRHRLVVSGIFFIIFFIIGFIYVKDIYSFFIKDVHFDLNITIPGDIIWIYFTMSDLVALISTIPIISLQIWLFIKPGLTVKEQRASLTYIPAIFILFISGLVFGYLVFIKLILPFLLSLNDGMFNELFTVEKYFKFLFHVTLP